MSQEIDSAAASPTGSTKEDVENYTDEALEENGDDVLLLRPDARSWHQHASEEGDRSDSGRGWSRCRIVLAVCLVLVVAAATLAIVLWMLSKRMPVPGRRHEACTTRVGEQLLVNGLNTPRLNHTRLVSDDAPKDYRVVGIVFYGRRRTVDILDCYLQRNLVANGGLLNEVRFFAHTPDAEDLAYLESLVSKQRDYHITPQPPGCQLPKFSCLWDTLVNPQELYLKIDDDIVFIDDDVIPRLVERRVQDTEAWGVSANIVNTPFMAGLHYYLGAIHPLVPSQRTAPCNAADPHGWRVDECDFDQAPDTWQSYDFDPPYRGHTWRPLTSPGRPQLLDSPVGLVMREHGNSLPGDDLWLNWALAAQQHYSLLQNVEQEALSLYIPGNETSALDTQYVRYNLNFFLIWGKDVAKALPLSNDDEYDMTAGLPERFHRPHLIETGSVVAHLHFNLQADGVLQTDLIDRYRSLANEKACAANNQKVPLDPACPGFG